MVVARIVRIVISKLIKSGTLMATKEAQAQAQAQAAAAAEAAKKLEEYIEKLARRSHGCERQ